MNLSKTIIAALAIATTFSMTSCDKDSKASAESGQVSFEITDAPIDNANVSGAFVTIADVKVDGQSWAGFSGKQTIDLMAYQNGSTKALGNGSLDVGAYSNVELVLDYAQDAQGNEPGCYILTTDNAKANLNSTTSSTGSIVINQSSFDVASSTSSTYVIDFDLRKAIEKGSGEAEYKFKSAAKLNAALRSENKAAVGTIQGKISNAASASTDKVVVYAYKNGTYSDSEASSNANTQFEGAVTSASADANGNYTLSFLQEGDYDLVYCNYDDTDNDGEMELTGKLSLNLVGDLSLQSASVSSSTTATVDITAYSVLAF